MNHQGGDRSSSYAIPRFETYFRHCFSQLAHTSAVTLAIAGVNLDFCEAGFIKASQAAKISLTD
ncbi:hypothetical protein [Pseudomonas rustica]